MKVKANELNRVSIAVCCLGFSNLEIDMPQSESIEEYYAAREKAISDLHAKICKAGRFSSFENLIVLELIKRNNS